LDYELDIESSSCIALYINVRITKDDQDKPDRYSMATTSVEIRGTSFLINGHPTYEDIYYNGQSIEGLLFNSRMVQAIFDDENLETRPSWGYPDNLEWDPDRNTREFCAMLPEYRRHGLLAITVGMQGGGSIFTKNIYDSYVNSAYTIDGTFKQPYFDRMELILDEADRAGMIVIVNYFYHQQARLFNDETILPKVNEAVTNWLLESGHENIIVDIANETRENWGHPMVTPGRIHELITMVKDKSANGRHLLVASSSSGGWEIPHGKWLEVEDVSLPHGNGCSPAALKMKIEAIREEDEYINRPRPIVVNEDSTFVENLEVAIEAGASWGFYCQGFGSDYKDLQDWTVHGREQNYDDLSGFQTVPVNWRINTPDKKRFFNRLKEITSGKLN
jgi:hypothetical protein